MLVLERREAAARLLPTLQSERDVQGEAGYHRGHEGWTVAEKALGQQVVECVSCGRAAVVVCLHCHPTCGDVPKRYTVDQIEEMVLRWCGWPERTIQNIRYVVKCQETTERERRETSLPEPLP